MFRRLSLLDKIYGGFGVMLILITIVAGVGYTTLPEIRRRADRMLEMNQIVRDSDTARQFEKEFILNHDPSSVKKVLETLDNLVKQAADSKQKFRQEAHKQEMDQVIKEADDYRKAFNTYVSYTEKRISSLNQMKSLLQIALSNINSIYEKQQKLFHESIEKSDQLAASKMSNFQAANDLLQLYLEVTRIRGNLMNQIDEASLGNWRNLNAKIIALSGELRSKLTSEQEIRQIDLIVQNIQAYQDNFLKYLDTREPADQEAFLANGTAAVNALKSIWNVQMEQFKNLQAEYSASIRNEVKKAVLTKRLTELIAEIEDAQEDLSITRDRRYADNVKSGIDKLLTETAVLKADLRDSETGKLCDEITASIKNYQAEFVTYAALTEQQMDQENKMTQIAINTQNICDQAVAEQQIKMGKQMIAAQRKIALWSVIAFLAALCFGFVLARRITGALHPVIEGVIRTAEIVGSASSQLAAGTQSLSEGASEQAASVQQTTATLEEMSAMTKANANNADQAELFMKEANAIIQKANQTITGLTASMQEIIQSSKETSQIVKTIDEIAFQTNLLALNAAVEAARAGQAGAGFAVVADEVRNLAMRAAQAAKNTSSLIDSTVKKIGGGSQLVIATGQAFSEVSAGVSKVSALIAEISAASNEQAQGIAQLNSAVIEMEKVIQQNASLAEQSASASEQLNQTAQHMKKHVESLVLLVEGTDKSRDTGISQTPDIPKTESRFEVPEDTLLFEESPPQKTSATKIPKKSELLKSGPTRVKTSDMKPEAIIPLNEDEFKDF